MKQKRCDNQSKIFRKINASKFQGQHAPQFSFYRYEGLCPATKTEIHKVLEQLLLITILKRKERRRRKRSDPCDLRFSLFPGQLFQSFKIFLNIFLHSGVFQFGLSYQF